MEAATTDLAPGLYPGIDAAEYHAWPGASASRLSDVARSAAHARYRMDHPETADALTFGSACHAAILEPAKFVSDYAIVGQCAAITGKGARCANSGTVELDGEWFCGVKGHAPAIAAALSRTALSADDGDRIGAMARAVRSHPAAANLLAMPGDVEVSFVWDCPQTGVRCKGRADKLVTLPDGGRIVLDLKTTQDASREAFSRSLKNFGYHRQAAHYLAGLAALGVAAEAFVVVAVEKEPPHGVAVYQVEDASLDQGREELWPLLRTWGRCVASGEWAGYSELIQAISLPAWAFKAVEE